MKVGDRVRVIRQTSAAHGAMGRVIRRCSTTDQCLVAMNAGRGIVWLSVDALEAV